jgi:PEGA domain
MRASVLVVLFAVSGALSGCATIMAGGPDHIPVSTNPPGATVFVDNVPVGQTPVMVRLDRQHSSGVIRIEMAGFAPIVIVRGKEINGWFWANLCIGGLIGIVIDLVTGDVKAFDDAPIAIGLTPAYGPQPMGPGQGPPPSGPYAPPPGYPPPGYPPPGYPPPPSR